MPSGVDGLELVRTPRRSLARVRVRFELAQRLNRKLRDIADGVVLTGGLPA